MKLPMKIKIINGVNLGMLGTREVNIYGHTDFPSYFSELEKRFPQCELSYCQSDRLEDLVDAILHASDCEGIILNPGAFTHTSVVLADAVRSVPIPVVEVHISNLFSREQYRRNNCLSGCCCGFISGFGLKGYELAVISLLKN